MRTYDPSDDLLDIAKEASWVTRVCRLRPIDLVTQKGLYKRNIRRLILLAMLTIRKGVIMPGTAEIRRYILATFELYRARGEDACILVSGDIHREMNLMNSMPSVCNVMYQLRRPGDEILNRTPSGKSSTIKIKYHLE